MWKDTREDRLKRYEECLESCPLLLETSRSLQADDGVLPDHTIRDVCNYVLSPALTAYVLWVLMEAVQSKKVRLYFLARDARFMYETACRFCEKLKLPIECRYLSCSRFSVRIPLYHLDFEEALDYICRGGIDVTMKKILNRTGLAEEEQEKVFADLKKNCAIEFEIDTPVPYAELGKIRAALQKSSLFQESLVRHSAEELPGLLGYLGQEGLFEDLPMAVVDSGWVGSMQKLLGRARELGRKGAAPSFRLEGYYWGLYELPAGVDASAYHCYYFSPKEGLKEKISFSNCLFEAVFSAPHGMTLSYRQQEDGYQPVYAEVSSQHKQVMEWMGKQFERYTEQFLFLSESGRRAAIYQDALKPPASGRIKDPALLNLQYLCAQMNRRTVRTLLSVFMSSPTREEAETFGSLPFSDDVVDYSGRQLAALLTEEELTANHVLHKMFAMFGITDRPVRESAWYEGSAVRGGKHVNRHLRRYAFYKRLLYLRKR